MRHLISLVLVMVCAASVASAQSREWIGTARVFTNDYLGDGRDRWRTGSYSYSHLRGRTPYDGHPGDFGDILEYRFRSEIISPSADSTTRGDRPYVGALSAGAFTHFSQGSALLSLGAEVTAIGPQTGVSDFQERFHDRYDMPQPPFIDGQLGDQFHLSIMGEVATELRVNDRTVLRPFAGVQIGTEDWVRYGLDVRIATFGQGSLMVRDVVSGQLTPATAVDGRGWEIVAGTDITFVRDSLYLPAADGYVAKPSRARTRIGFGYKFDQGSSLFYGATYLSPEFEGQSSGQTVGSLRINFVF